MRMGDVESLEVVEYERDDFAERFNDSYVAGNLPFLVRGAADLWPAVGKWDLDYLIEECRGRVVKVMEDSGPQLIEDALERIRSGTNIFLAPDIFRDFEWSTGQRFELPELRADCPTPSFLLEKKKRLVAYIGRESFSRMHFHGGDLRTRTAIQALKTQLVGTKTVLMFSPNTDLDACTRERFGASNFSSMSFEGLIRDENRDFDRYPQLRNATAYECLLEPGDSLFIPSYWWHSFYGHGVSISATYFWEDFEPNDCLSSINYRYNKSLHGVSRHFDWFFNWVNARKGSAEI